ncbi:MAG: hypothetical protein Q8J85_07060 [Sulfuricurvum sp.]|nr:hypothetical protein [Sulfuricurvum sp.]MDP3023015.1 hypothetical protein [Sulfuricurvum sp.]
MKNTIELLNRASHIIDVNGSVVGTITTPIVDIDFSEDVKSFSDKYNVVDVNKQEELLKVMKKITKVKTETKKTIISIGEKSDLLMLQSILMKLNIDVSKEIADFENNSFNSGELKKKLKEVKSSIPKIVNPFKIAKMELEKEGKPVNVKNLVEKTGLTVKDAETYLKRLEVVKLAQAGRTKK